MVSIHVITVSDRVSRGEAEDTSGPLALDMLSFAKEHFSGQPIDIDGPIVVPDDQDAIRRAIAAAIEDGADVVFTTGGTGVGPRDVTPEATRPLLDLEIPGIADAMRRAGAASVPASVFSRGLVGIVRARVDFEGDRTGPSVIVNMPGSPGGVKDALTVVLPLLPHLLDQIGGGDH